MFLRLINKIMSSKQYYLEEDIRIMKVARNSVINGVDKTEEIIGYAKEAGIKKLGVAYCISYSSEAEILINRLRNANFEVESVHCKYDRLQFADIIEGYRGTACNPAGQAAYLAEKETELNIAIGLCLGHDMIFNKKSEAPVTTAILKDRVRR